MSRLIDADALMNSVQGYNDAGWLEEQVDKQPTVDAVEVVRCKDCMFSKKVDRREPKYECENIFREGCIQWIGSDDYCSYGYRKESVSK